MSGKLPRLRALRPRPQHQVKLETIPRVEINVHVNEKRTDSEDHVENETGDKSSDVYVSTECMRKVDHETVLESEQAEIQLSQAVHNYVCKLCKPPKVLSNVKTYVDHLKKEHKQKDTHTLDMDVNRCPMCSYFAPSVQDLEAHQRIHHLKRRFFRCAKCSYVTHVRARYTKHVKYHSMPMIKCDTCDFRTPYKWNLDRHTRNHGGGGAFQCRACNFTADIRQSLTVHETNHHEPPVGQANRKSNAPFERKPRNSPKRYNQVGASDFRESMNISGSASINSTELFISSNVNSISNSIDDKVNSLANAECIALKCEETGCQFITAWDSEMQRHLAECHAPLTHCKSRKPLPMLIPLSPQNVKASNNTANTSTMLLRVPRVRVRPELAQIARDTEIAKLYGNKETISLKRDSTNAANAFEKKNASFFDKLKEKLTTSASAISNGLQEVAVSSTNDLKCWCTFKANSVEELASHKQTHHTALSVSVGTLRCPRCRRRCKSTTDLQVHTQCCRAANTNASSESTVEKASSNPDLRIASYRGEYAFPSEVEWESNVTRLNSSGSSVVGASTHPSGRRVFKCPHCPFWASTASRFHVHIVGHLNRKPFECSLCAYRSNWRWDITKHIKLKAAKDPVHMTARVLMTDETGRRNYSKYNKYLAQVEQAWNDQSMDEQSAEDPNTDEPPMKLLIVGNQEYLHAPEATNASVSILTTSDTNNSESTMSIPLRPPPPLKAAMRGRGQSLLKNNPVSTNVYNAMTSTSTSAETNMIDENRRTLWKCKRCNYRDSDKETVLLHVKSHYESYDQCSDEAKNAFDCGECPFSASDAASLSVHKTHHRPNLEAIFKCYLCPYYVSTKAELLDHARLHGEELAVVHQQSPVSKHKLPHISSPDNSSSEPKDDKSFDDVVHVVSQGNSNTTLSASRSSAPPPLLLDTRALPEPPLVWVSRPDGILAKMLKCRHCPYVSSRRADIMDHETMHVDSQADGSSIACSDCSFSCTRREVMIAHSDMHSGSLGTVHCLVDESRSDTQQLGDLATLLGLGQTPPLGSEPDLRDSRLVHCCGKCPARFLCEKELRIHLRYHSTELAYSCQWCSYAARQPAHLLAHQKAHSTEYQERTKYLLSLYGHSQRYPPPATACVEANNQECVDTTPSIAWIVVEITDSTQGFNNSRTSLHQKPGSQVFTCAKCPARYFKLDALEYHMTLHGSNNRFKCTECDYSSKTGQNLLKHQVVHRRHNDTKEATPPHLPPPPDPQFGVYMRGNPNFVYPGYLRNGRLKEKRYKCHKCPSAFEKREQYRVHLTLHGAKQRYRCDTCDYSVKYYANYVQHLKKHQANAEAQASRRQFEDDTISIDNDCVPESIVSISRSGKTLKSPAIVAPITSSVNNSINCPAMQASNQDKQSLIIMQKKGILVTSVETEAETIRCQNCPFSTTDKDAMDVHKRRHGIERMTPSCPHCDYIPRKDENVGEHIRLHFNRLYKPESYLIIELLTLTMKKISTNGKEEKQKASELLFKECADGTFFPVSDVNSMTHNNAPSNINTFQEKVIVDPNTGEAKHHLTI